MKVALLIGDHLPDWLAASIERMVRETNTEVTLVVRAQHTESDDLMTQAVRVLREEGLLSFVESGVLFGLGKLDLWRRFYDHEYPHEHHPPTEIAGVDDAEFVNCEVERVSKDRVRLPDDIVELLGSRADLVVHSSVGILVGDVLTATKHGVVGFHMGNVRKHRGTFPGLWQFLNGEPTATMTLQRYTPTLDGGEVVVERSADIRDAKDWTDVQRRTLYQADSMLAEAVQKFGDPTFEPEAVPAEELGSLHVQADKSVRLMLRYHLTRLGRTVRRRFR